jgi:murein L,D-transpeptidase YcbB/YkuD
MLGGPMRARAPLPILWLAAALLALAPATDAQEAAAPAPIQALVERREIDALRGPRFGDPIALLTAIYEPRGWAPLWVDDGEPTRLVGDVADALRDAAVHGLDPADYDGDRLAAEAQRLDDERRPSADAQARFDVAVSLGFLRFLSDLHGGRVDPRKLGYDYDAGGSPIDLAAILGEAVRERDVAAAIEAAQPPFRQRRLLGEQLAIHRALAADATLAPPAIAIDAKRRKIVAGDPLPEAEALVRWLAALGDLPRDARATALYDDALAAGVTHFQSRHGLEPDGVIGPATARELAVPIATRTRQIELALERLRWIPTPAGARAVLVNLASFELAAYDAIGPDAAPALQMAVVVGRATRMETPIFADHMESVVFAPYWNVPRSIVKDEILPKVAKQSDYLAKENMEIVGGDGSVAALASGSARVRQRPGRGNSLGRVKFLFPNSHDVYLHDTPSRSLFQRSRRDFSHGCIRVAEPELLARWVLAPEGWDDAQVASALARKSERGVPVTQPIAVVLYYTTAVARPDGTITFHPDVYDHDAALERALGGSKI